MNNPKTYNGSLTREQFLFYEMRTTARLLNEGSSDQEIVSKVVEENLFQYPTERMLAGMARVCLKRLHSMEDANLISAIAVQPSEAAKQVCLYAMMKQNRLVREFMVNVIGEKYRQKALSFGKVDVNSFFMQLQEQNDDVASWSENTVTKIKQVLVKILVETEYLENRKADHLNSVWLQSVLENAIRNHGDQYMLPAFNCFV